MNVFSRILSGLPSFDKNNLQNTKNKTANVVNLVSKLAKELFRPYLGSGNFDRLKITTKVLNIEQQVP